MGIYVAPLGKKSRPHPPPGTRVFGRLPDQ